MIDLCEGGPSGGSRGMMDVGAQAPLEMLPCCPFSIESVDTGLGICMPRCSLTEYSHVEIYGEGYPISECTWQSFTLIVGKDCAESQGMFVLRARTEWEAGGRYHVMVKLHCRARKLNATLQSPTSPPEILRSAAATCTTTIDAGSAWPTYP
jgi:hypothetical protein